MSTPHARGSTLHPEILATGAGVYPACAGIHPIKITQKACNLSLPRMRGDPPTLLSNICQMSMSTPHARGSTPKRP
mgnify:CR=1 FL=1